MNHDERLKRADNAKQLLDNQYFQDAFKDIREGLVSSAESCKWDDKTKQTNIMLSLQLLKGLKSLMVSHLNDGKVAQKEIDNLNKPRLFKMV